MVAFVPQSGNEKPLGPWTKDLYFALKIQKNTSLLIFNFLKQKKLIFNLVVNRNWKKLTYSPKRARILADNRKSYHPIETLYSEVQEE